MKATSSREKLTQWVTSFQVVAKNSTVPVLKLCWNTAAADVCVSKQLWHFTSGGHLNHDAHWEKRSPGTELHGDLIVI